MKIEFALTIASIRLQLIILEVAKAQVEKIVPVYKLTKNGGLEYLYFSNTGTDTVKFRTGMFE